MKDINFDNIDISLLSIHAANELARKKKGLETNLESVQILASLLENSFTEKILQSGKEFRLDHISLVNKAISNSLGIHNLNGKKLSDIAAEAYKIATQLHHESMYNHEDDNLVKLISFCIALSKSAALYQLEQEELYKHFA